MVTALWHWYKVNPMPESVKFIKDVSEIVTERPPEPPKEEEKKADEAEGEEKKEKEGEEKKEG